MGDFGVNDIDFEINSHLGYILKPGDTAYGYDLANANFTEHTMGRKQKAAFPDVVLVKKSYPKKNRSRKRKWVIKSLPKEAPERAPRKMELLQQEKEYEEFLQAIEEDPELRNNVNLYTKDDTEVKGHMDEDEDEGDALPELTGLLEDVTIDAETIPVDQPPDEDEDDAPIDFSGFASVKA